MLLFALVALLIHALIVLPLISLLLTESPAEDGEYAFDIDLWSQSGDDAASDPQPSDDAIVVDMPENASPPAPESTRYLSRTGSSTTKQTKQRGSGRRSVPGSEASQSAAEKAAFRLAESVESAESAESAESKDTQRTEAASEVSEISNAHSETALRAAPPKPQPLKLRPDSATLEKAISGSGLADLGDIAEGDQTSLNSAAFRHASFFIRVQKMVEQFWHPDVAMQQHDPDAKFIGTRDRVTTLLVVLHRDGRIHHLYTQTPSGAGFLDDAATRAVKMAGPFPNVPEGLIGSEDGLVKFLFQFRLEINRNPAIRVRRYD